MTRDEARALLHAELAPYERQSFQELLPLLDTKKGYALGEAWIDIYALWDDPKMNRLRVWGSVSYSTLTHFFPLTETFLVDNPVPIT